MALNMVVPLEVGIVCRDLPALRKFYQDVLGCTFVSEITITGDKSAPSAMSADGYTVVRLQTSNGERIKLVQPNTEPVAVNQTDYVLDRLNASYLTFIVDDIDAAIATFLGVGVAFMTGDKKVEVRDGVYLAFCRDPEGNILELVEYRDVDTYRADLKKGSN